MNYFIQFEDGSDGYLSHHGVLGMKWGVRNAETKARYANAKQYQKTLNNQDRRMQYDQVSWYNAHQTQTRYERKARKAQQKGKNDKANRYTEKARVAANYKHAYGADYINTGKQYADTVHKMRGEGYSFKITPTEFNQYFPSARQQGKEMTAKYGKLYLTMNSNAASGNKWKVRDPSQLSEKKKAKWNAKHTLQQHRPQAVYYY